MPRHLCAALGDAEAGSLGANSGDAAAATRGGESTGVVHLRACTKCIGRRGGGFDPRPVLEELSGSGGPVLVESGACLGPCASGPNVQLAVEVGDRPRAVTVEGMTPRERTYRCFLQVADEEAAARVYDLARRLAEGDLRPAAKIRAAAGPPSGAEAVPKAPPADEAATRKARAEAIAAELAESRAYRERREAASGAAGWRDSCR